MWSLLTTAPRSGPGGQKINKTNSAVQLIHEPTGIVIKSQATRSRSQNRKIARQILAEKLEELNKGPESRTQLKIQREIVKKASATKKTKRKYRRLEREMELRRDAFMERPEPPQGWSTDFGYMEQRSLTVKKPERFKRGQKEELEWEDDKPTPRRELVKDSNGVMVDQVIEEDIEGEVVPMQRKRLEIKAKHVECHWAWNQPGLVEMDVPEDDIPEGAIRCGDEDEHLLVYRGNMGAEWREAKEANKEAIKEGRLAPPPEPEPKKPKKPYGKIPVHAHQQKKKPARNYSAASGFSSEEVNGMGNMRGNQSGYGFYGRSSHFDSP
jgi:hypothetical protein